MKKLFLNLLGYKLIDLVSSEWEHIFLDSNFKEKIFVDYSHYSIFYNPKKNKYKMLLNGFRPMTHSNFFEMTSIINFLNYHNANPSPEIKLTNTSQDYFMQVYKLKEEIEKLQEPSESFFGANQISILRLPLESFSDNLAKIQSEDTKLVTAMKKYKDNILLKNPDIEIYNDYGNVVVTSDGCYFTAYNSSITTPTKENDEDNNETEEE